MLLIGIDVGMQASNTGVAIYCTEQREIIDIYSCSFYQMQCYLNAYPLKYKDQKIAVVLENANQDNATFIKGTSKAVAMKISRDAGKNQAGAIIVIQQLKALGVPCLSIAPSMRQKAKKFLGIDILQLRYPTKSTAKQFNKLTGKEYGRRDTGTQVL
jgi:hypothetical protein